MCSIKYKLFYCFNSDEKEVTQDILSRYWFTYRKGFNNIGGVGGPDTDQGWGCMIRCGQMLLAECFSRLYLSRSFKWEPKCENTEYWKILSSFNDEKLASYSIQQIGRIILSITQLFIKKYIYNCIS